MDVKRGEIYFAGLDPVIDSEQGGIRPVLILLNDEGNWYAPTVVAAITSKIKKTVHTYSCKNQQIRTRSNIGSLVMIEQLRTIDKS